MVKPDVKHNYYADLDLPTNATVDDVRKAYRKLALQYHPDRNAGNEAECVPRFQAIQAANEVLSDPTTKARYDADRRKAGVFPGTSSKPSVPTPTGHPYAATSAFPPPPRRTQPGTWQRPTSSTAAGSTPSGADRFTNFPKQPGVPPRREQQGTDRTSQFRAWQHMNNGSGSGTDSRRYASQPAPTAKAPNKPPTPSRPGVPRQDTKLPTEEQIRAGMRHGNAASSGGDPLHDGQSAWQSFQSAQQNRARAKRPVPPTPKRPTGFDPNAPGSDERPAPPSRHYSRHRSEDFTADGFPPPPPGPPPAAVPPSPTSPSAHKTPYADPLRAFKQRTHDEDVPYSEGNRASSPYSTYSGERTKFSSENLRRSASVRDATKLNAESPSRARSTSPLRRAPQTNGNAQNESKGTGFIPGMYSDSSSASSENDAADGHDEATSRPQSTSSGAAHNRPIKTPKPRSRKFADSSKSPSPHATDRTAFGAQSDTERPNMQQRKNSANMYAPSFSFSSSPARPTLDSWAARNFGRRKSIPNWAVPSFVLLQKKPKPEPLRRDSAHAEDIYSMQTDPVFQRAPREDREAFAQFRSRTMEQFSDNAGVSQLSMSDFALLATNVSRGGTTGLEACDIILHDIFAQSRARNSRNPADHTSPPNRFNIPLHHDTFTSTNGKSRSEENINTSFSPGGWNGTFTGATGAESSSPPKFARRDSPGLRNGSMRRTPTVESVNFFPTGMPPPPPPDSTRPSVVVPPSPADSTRPGATGNSPSNVKFSKEEWEKTFADGSWTWPPPPPNPPMESKPFSKKTPSRKGSRLQSKSSKGSTASNGSSGANAGSQESPFVVEDDDQAEPDAMDIDTPPAARTADTQPDSIQSASTKEARVYSVPLSTWRQEQGIRFGSPTSAKPPRAPQPPPSPPSLKTNLDDLSHVEPLARDPSSTAGLHNLADMSATLPFASQASSTTPHSSDSEPQKLQVPAIPKAPDQPPKWTKSSWHDYAQRFAAYLSAYHSFNRTIVAHFDAREKQAAARLQGGMGWLEAVGDVVSSGTGGVLKGWTDYAKAVKEDEVVRETWNVAGERHRVAVEEFEGRRERVRELSVRGALGEN